MGAINTGNQTVFFNYHKALTGANMNLNNYLLRTPGVINGCEVTKNNNTSVDIDAGLFNISDGTYTVTVHKQSLQNLVVTNPDRYVVARYTYSAAENWYADILNVSSPAANDVVLGVITYAAGNVSTVDSSLSAITNGNKVLDVNVMITANSLNMYMYDAIVGGYFGPYSPSNSWLDKLTDSWLAEDAAIKPPHKRMIGNILPAAGFDNVDNRYLYFYLRTCTNVVDIKFVMHVCGDLGSANNVKLNLDYAVISNGLAALDTLVFTTGATELISMPAVAYTNKKLTTATLKIPSAVSGSGTGLMILCRLTRDYNHANDNYAGEIDILQMIPTT